MKKDNFKWMVLLSAMTIVGMSAYYSIFGISSLFAGKRLFAGIMAGSLEFGKVVTTTHLTRNWNKIGHVYKTYFILATIVLIIISSAGIYSYLTDAYQQTTQNMKVVDTKLNSLSSEEQSLTSEKELLVEDRDSAQREITSLRNLINSNEDRKAKLYEAMNADTTNTINWNASIWKFNKDNGEYRNNIEELRKSKDTSSNRIKTIDERMKQIWAESGSVEASDEASNIGPLKKLSELFNVEMDKVVKFFILIIIIVFDPLGILLVVQFNKMLLIKPNEIKKEKIIDDGIDIENKEIPTKPIVEKVIDKIPEKGNIIISSVISSDNSNTDINDEIKKNSIDETDPIVNDVVNPIKSSSFTKDVRHKGVRVN